MRHDHDLQKDKKESFPVRAWWRDRVGSREGGTMKTRMSRSSQRSTFTLVIAVAVFAVPLLLYIALRPRHPRRRDAIASGATRSLTARAAPPDADEVLPGLYLGAATSASNSEWLRSHGITHILNVGASPTRHQVTGVRYLNLNISDRPSADIASLFGVGADFIRDTLASGQTVLVHCHAGVSRSPTIVAAYLMRTYGLSAEQALLHISKARPVIRPNVGFLRQLASYHPYHP
jgi:atypical dual specificity phosphatase